MEQIQNATQLDANYREYIIIGDAAIATRDQIPRKTAIARFVIELVVVLRVPMRFADTVNIILRLDDWGE